MTDPADLGARKAAARKTAFAARKLAHEAALASGGDACAALTASLAPHAGKMLAGYMPIRTEIDPRPAMLAHIAAGGQVCLPVVEAEGQPLSFRRWTPEAEMIPGAFGAAIPADPAPVVPEVMIVPLVAFARGGQRLGYGGGFYDRTLEGLRAAGRVTAIGFAYGAQELPDLPLEPTDQPLDLMVTEAGVVWP